MDEQQHPHRPVRRQVQLVERLEAPPLRHVGVGEVDQARRTCSSIFSMAFSSSAGATKRNTSACAAPCTTSPRRPLVRRVAGGCVGLRRRPWAAAGRRSRSVPCAGRRRGLRTPGRVHRQVPGVDPVALEQHDGVLTGGYVDLELHVPGRLLAGFRRGPWCARGVRSTRSTRSRSLSSSAATIASLLATARPSGPLGKSTRPGLRGRSRRTTRCGDSKRAPREARRHDVNSLRVAKCTCLPNLERAPLGQIPHDTLWARPQSGG